MSLFFVVVYIFGEFVCRLCSFFFFFFFFFFFLCMPCCMVRVYVGVACVCKCCFSAHDFFFLHIGFDFLCMCVLCSPACGIAVIDVG